jgi:hypothetical protein
MDEKNEQLVASERETFAADSQITLADDEREVLIAEQEQPEVDEQTVEPQTDTYEPRNAVVRAKESLYARMNISVRQIDGFIIGCVALVILLVVIGVLWQ